MRRLHVRTPQYENRFSPPPSSNVAELLLPVFSFTHYICPPSDYKEGVPFAIQLRSHARTATRTRKTLFVKLVTNAPESPPSYTSMRIPISSFRFILWVRPKVIMGVPSTLSAPLPLLSFHPSSKVLVILMIPPRSLLCYYFVGGCTAYWRWGRTYW